MTYQEFVSTFTSGCNLVFNSLYSMCESLMTNYIFLTFLGLTLVISLFWFLYHIFIDDVIYVNIDNLDRKLDYAERYRLYRDVRYDYNNSHTERNENEAIYHYQINRVAKRKVFDPLGAPSLSWLYEPNVDSKTPTSNEVEEMKKDLEYIKDSINNKKG